MQELRLSSEKFLKMLKKEGADDVVLSLSQRKGSQVKFSNNKINLITLQHDSTMSVFASFKKRIVTTLIKDFDEKALKKSAASLSKFANSTDPNPQYCGIAEGPFKYKRIEGIFDKRILDLGEKAVDYVEEALSRAVVGRVKKVAGVLESVYDNSYLLTSNNVEKEEKSTGMYFSIRAILNNDESAHSVTASRTLNTFNSGRCAEEAAEIVNEKYDFVQLKPGNYDIIFYPLPFAVLLNLVADACSIFNIEAGISFLQGLLGKNVAQKSFSLSDDATMPYGFGSTAYDEEGVPTQKNVLIERGLLKTYLHNTSTAKRYKTKTTANAGLIMPHHFNLVLERGKHRMDELIEEVKRGIIVTNIWYTRFQNYKSGEFSTMPRDKIFVIENGEKRYCTRGIRIADKLLNVLRNTEHIGSECKQVVGWEVDTPVTTASVLARKINVTKPMIK